MWSFLKTDVKFDEITIPAGPAELKASLHENPTFKSQLQERTRGVVERLVKQARDFTAEAVKTIRRERATPDKKIVLIVDSVERLRGVGDSQDVREVFKSAETLFASHADKLRFTGVSTVYTVPPYLSALAGSLGTYMEWDRLWQQTEDKTRISPWDGFAAFESAMERGDLSSAGTIAQQGLKLARALRHSLGDTSQALRDLPVSLNHVGQVERDLGNLEAARAAYAESLEIGRALRHSLGGTPQALRDLSATLMNIGKTERALGNIQAARTALDESLKIIRHARKAYPDHSQFQLGLELVQSELDKL